MKKVNLIVILVCFMLLVSCASVQQRKVEFENLTTYQKAEYMVKQSFKVEDYYKNIVKAYSDAYGDYIANPSKENLNYLVIRRDVYNDVNKLYEKWQPLHNQLISFLELYTGTIDDEVLLGVTEDVMELVKQILVKQIGN